MKISVVVAMYNEEGNVAPLIQEVDSALSGISYELILVDDGSTDRSVAEALESALSNTRVVQLQKNYGQTQAMSAGIQAAKGELIVTMDADLQNDPSDIPAMVKQLEEGDFDLVAGIRAKRKDGLILRKIPSKIANYFIRRLTGVYVSDYGCTLKVFRPFIARNLGMYGELHRFIPVLARLQGARIAEQPVNHRSRVAGKSKYGLGRTGKVASDLLLMLFFQKYFQRPIHLFGPPGYICLAAGGSIELYLLVCKLMGQEIGGRPLLMLGVLLIFAGIQLITFGLLAEMLMRIYFESQGKHPFRVRKEYSGGQLVAQLNRFGELEFVSTALSEQGSANLTNP